MRNEFFSELSITRDRLRWCVPTGIRVGPVRRGFAPMELRDPVILFSATEDQAVRSLLLDRLGLPAETGRVFMMDAEELGEKGITPFIEAIKPFFTRLGLSLSIEDSFDDEGYSFRLNGKKYKCWSEDQIEESWIRTIVALGKAVNQVLEAAGSDERMYGLHAGGNDGFAVFLTEEQFRTIRETNELAESEKPVELTLKKLR